MKNTNKRSLAWFNSHLKFWMGGTKFILEILELLQDQYRETILCNGGSKEVIQKFEKANVKVKTLIQPNTNSPLYWLFLPLFLIVELYKSKDLYNSTDVIIATLFPSNLLCAIHSKITKKPYYFYCFEPFPFLQNQQFINTFPQPKRIFLNFLSILYKSADTWATNQALKVFTLNEVTQRTIKQTYGVESIITLMGVDSDHFSPQKSLPTFIKNKNELIITHSTDYTDMKRTDLAITSFAKASMTIPNLHLYITSTQPNSPDKKKYDNLVKKHRLQDKITFLGLVSYDEIPKLYSASLCYLSCSYDEMLGTTSSNLPVKEALACGTPAIRANITTEDAQDGVSGFLVDPRDTDMVAQKIVYFAHHQKEARAMGMAGRDKIVKLYQWKHVAKTIADNIK